MILVPSTESTLRRACYSEVHASAVRVIAACRAYEREMGELPESLDQLVPAYLDAVPRDPYDGKPVRYSKSKAIVYAVGVDLVDSNGSIKATNPKYEGLTRTLRFHGEDVVFEIYPDSGSSGADLESAIKLKQVESDRENRKIALMSAARDDVHLGRACGLSSTPDVDDLSI